MIKLFCDRCGLQMEGNPQREYLLARDVIADKYPSVSSLFQPGLPIPLCLCQSCTADFNEVQEKARRVYYHTIHQYIRSGNIGKDLEFTVDFDTGKAYSKRKGITQKEEKEVK